MSTEMGQYVAAWRRAGARSGSFQGVLYVPMGVDPAVKAWACSHRHAEREQAEACAITEATARQEPIPPRTLAECIAVLAKRWPELDWQSLPEGSTA
jgi:hypothetical protein